MNLNFPSTPMEYCHPRERLCDLYKVTELEGLRRLQILGVSFQRSCCLPLWELAHLLRHPFSQLVYQWVPCEGLCWSQSCPEVATRPLASSQAQSSELLAPFPVGRPVLGHCGISSRSSWHFLGQERQGLFLLFVAKDIEAQKG